MSGTLELYGATHSRRTSGGILESVLWSQSCTRKSDAWRPENPSLRLSLPWWWDNLNTHGMGFLYGAFPPEQARRLASRLERVMHSHKGNTTVGTEAKRVPGGLAVLHSGCQRQTQNYPYRIFAYCGISQANVC